MSEYGYVRVFSADRNEMIQRDILAFNQIFKFFIVIFVIL